MEEFAHCECLKGMFVYVGNITICSNDKLDHDDNLNWFMLAAEKYSLILNQSKCTFSTGMISLQEYEVSKGNIHPDPTQFEALRNLPAPHDLKA